LKAAEKRKGGRISEYRGLRICGKRRERPCQILDEK